MTVLDVGRVLVREDPSDGSLLERVPVSTEAEIIAAVAAARAAVREMGKPVATVKVNAVFGGAPGGAAHPRAGSGQGYGYGPELLDELTAAKVVHLRLLPAV